MKAVILAGGLGVRLRPYTATRPKPMLLLGKKPILEHIIKWIHDAKIHDIVLCTSYMHKSIQKYFGDGLKFNVNIEYVTTKKPMSTAGQLRSASNLLDSTFICVYGDSIFDYSLSAMIHQHIKTKPTITIATSKYTSTIPYGVIHTTRNSITAWTEKPTTSSLINIGCYVMEPKILKLIPRNTQVGMDTTVTKAISKNMRIMNYTIRGSFIDVGDLSSYKKARTRFSVTQKRSNH